MKIVIKKSFLLLAVGCLGLAGCVVLQPESNQTLVHSVACYPETQDARVSTLSQKGIRVDMLGDDVFLTLPLSYAFSNAVAATVDSGFQSTAALIAQFLQCYNRTTTTVTVYNDVLATRAQNQVLSAQQAQAVMDMLWDAGLTDNVMVASGAGKSTKQDKAGDRRISIKTTLRGGAE
ncbi:MAG: OmpA family protein [Pseudomonadota bacterium]